MPRPKTLSALEVSHKAKRAAKKYAKHSGKKLHAAASEAIEAGVMKLEKGGR